MARFSSYPLFLSIIGVTLSVGANATYGSERKFSRLCLTKELRSAVNDSHAFYEFTGSKDTHLAQLEIKKPIIPAFRWLWPESPVPKKTGLGSFEQLNQVHGEPGSKISDLIAYAHDHSIARGLTISLSPGEGSYPNVPSTEPRDDLKRAWNAIESTERTRGTPLTESEIISMNNELVELAAKYLHSQGVQISINHTVGYPACALRILPEGTHPMNLKAIEINRIYGSARIVYQPEMQIRRGSTASFATDTNAILPSTADILQLNFGSPTFRHEQTHLRHHWDPDLDLGSSSSSSDDAKLPHVSPGSYSDYQGHDEPNTYLRTLRDMLDEWRISLSRGKSPPSWNELYATILIGREVSKRNVLIAQSEIGHSMFASDSFSRKPNGVWQVQLRGAFTSSIPLPGSSGPEDPANATILAKRLSLVGSLGAHAEPIFSVARYIFDRMWELRNQPKELRILVEAMRGIVRTPNWETGQQQALTEEELIVRTNQMIGIHRRRADATN